MKKTFRFLTLSVMLMVGALTSWAADVPKTGDIVGKSQIGGYVVYKVASNTPNGDGWYPVEIQGLSNEGIAAINAGTIELDVPTAFEETFGDSKYKFYVKGIVDGSTTTSFYGYTKITKLTFTTPEWQNKENFVIGEKAFYGCTKLAEINLPANVSEIKADAFNGTAITTFTIPKNLAKLAKGSFNECKKLVTVNVAEGNEALLTIGGNVFGNSQLTTLDLSNASKLETFTGEPFMKIGEFVNRQLTTVKLPSSMKDVDKAFANCEALTTITNLENTKIEAFKDLAFENCKALTTLNLPKGKSNTELLTGTPFKGCAALAHLVFPNDFYGIIGDNTNNVYGTAEADLDALEDITFKAQMAGWIANNSFVKCTSLSKVDFQGALANVDDAPHTKGIGAAFKNIESLTTVNFNGVTIGGTKTTGNVNINDGAFAGTSITSVDFKNISISNTNSAKAFTIATGAFACEDLATVTFGTITTSSKDHKVNILNDAFKSTALTDFTVGAISLGTSDSEVSFGTVGTDFEDAAKYANTLETVSITSFEGGVLRIAENAFRSDALTSVTIGNLASKSNTIKGYVYINKNAFAPASPTANLTLPEKTVKIGNISAWSTTISDYAFTGNLTTAEAGKYAVEIGNLDGNSVVIGYGAFAWTNEDASGALAGDENIKIGNLNGGVTINKLAFKGPQAADSNYDVEIGNFAKTANIAGAVEPAFWGPTPGTSSYKFGNINAASGVEQFAFTGSQDADGNNTTIVEIGDYNDQFQHTGDVRYVKTLKTGKWNVGGPLSRFSGVIEATIGEIPTGKYVTGATCYYLETINFTGAVADANSIRNFEGDKVRTITFPGKKDVLVAEGAVQSQAFKASGDALVAAGTDEKLIVVYQPEVERQAYNIFAQDAFGDTDDKKVVELYTTEWAKQFVFEADGVLVNRLQASDTQIAPGQAITVKMAKKEGDSKAFGKLVVPQGSGMKYKVAKVQGDATINLYSGYLDGTNIYMEAVKASEDTYWIDATDATQVFVVRSSTTDDVVAEAVEEGQGPSKASRWFNAADAEDNDLQYTESEVAKTELVNSTTKWYGKTIYVMANPAKRGFAFLTLDPSKYDMPAKSVYVLGTAAASRLNVIWVEEGETIDHNATAIESVETESENNDAIYNLQGVRVNKAQKGVYIQNGKKVIK